MHLSTYISIEFCISSFIQTWEDR